MIGCQTTGSDMNPSAAGSTHFLDGILGSDLGNSRGTTPHTPPFIPPLHDASWNLMRAIPIGISTSRCCGTCKNGLPCYKEGEIPKAFALLTISQCILLRASQRPHGIIHLSPIPPTNWPIPCAYRSQMRTAREHLGTSPHAQQPNAQRV